MSLWAQLEILIYCFVSGFIFTQNVLLHVLNPRSADDRLDWPFNCHQSAWADQIGNFFKCVLSVIVAWYVFRFPAKPEVNSSLFTAMLRFAAKSLCLCVKQCLSTTYLKTCFYHYKKLPIFFLENPKMYQQFRQFCLNIFSPATTLKYRWNNSFVM